MPRTKAHRPRTQDSQILGEHFRSGLIQFADRVGKLASKLDGQFAKALKDDSVLPAQTALLAAITPGAAVKVMLRSNTPIAFFENVQQAGYRLAKWNFPPAGLVAALQTYERLLDVSGIDLRELQWVREQLSFCTLLTLNDAYYRVREAETRKLEELFQIETETLKEDALFSRYLESLASFCGAQAATFHMAEDGGLRCMARIGKPPEKDRLVPISAALRRSMLTSGWPASSQMNLHWRGKFKSYWVVPLRVRSELRGVMEFAFQSQRECLPRDRSLLETTGERCLLGAQRLQLVSELADREQKIRSLAEHMLQVEEIERRRISRELHDEAGQSLVCIRLQLEMIEMSLPDSYSDLRERLAETRDLTEKTILDMRRLIADLSPVVLDQFGLAAAIRQLCKRLENVYPCRISTKLDHAPDVPHKLQMVVYRIVQECANNVAKHSQAKRVNISLTSSDGYLALRVADNGVGFDVDLAARKTDSFGLSGIRERVALLGGKFRIVSYPQSMRKKGKHGTEVLVEVPILPESTGTGPSELSLA